MSGVCDIKELLKNMAPELDERAEYVFLTVDNACTTNEKKFFEGLLVDQAVAAFREDEGLTLVLPEAYIKSHVLSTEGGEVPEDVRKQWLAIVEEAGSLQTMSRITMRIHSSLTAVGFTAAFSKALTEANISCNVFAGYFHDHIFVPSQDAKRAVQVLISLTH